jgi:general secretion pathway protein B
MSLILEALKKSEAERQLGRAPGLATPMPTLRRQRRSHWLPVALAAVALLVLMTGAAWWLGRGSPPSPPTRTPAPSTSSAAVPPTAEPTAPAASDPAAIAPAPIDLPRSSSVAQAPPRRDEPVPAPPAAPEFDSVERESRAVVASPPPATPAAAASTAAEPAAPIAATTPAPVDTVPLPPPAAPAPPSVGDAAAPAAEELPRIDHLAGPRRDALPPLKQTMHVYAEMPADRFVLIDGSRYREGDSLTAGLRLLEIRRDGSVLEFDGMRFLLPRP